MTTRSIAEERLLDIALEEALENAPAARARGPALFAATLFLCGIGVVAALLWQHRAATRVPVQEPQRAPLPVPVRADSPAELSALPVSATNIEARFASPAEFAGLRRFRDLRRLRMLPPVGSLTLPASADALRRHRDEAAAAAARFADAAQFATLGELHTLEALELPHDIAWTPAHFAFLRNLRLADFSVAVVDLREQPMIDALLAAPTFRTLRLTLARVSADLFRALQPLQLERLDLLACQGFDPDAWAAVARLRKLQHLEVTCVRGGTDRIGAETVEREALGDAAFAAFASLPELRHLGLDESEFPGDLLAQLPAKLTSLDLGDRPMTAGDARSLRRLTSLRSLTFGCGLDEQTAAAVLPAWSLERLDYRGNFWSERLLAAIATQPRLTELALHVRTRANLAPLTNAPQLRVLELSGEAWAPNDAGIPLAQLEPLAACKELRTLRLRATKLDETRVRDLLGDRVAVEIVPTP